MASTKDVKQLVKALESEGCEASLSSSHYRLTYEDKGPVFMPATPSDHRWMKNCLSQLRKDGFPIPAQYRTNKPKKKAPAPKRAPVQKVEATMVKQEEAPASNPKFERYVRPSGPARVSAGRSPYVFITKMKGLYLSAAATKLLGRPESIEVSVNRASAEMMIWSDDNGALGVTYANADAGSGTAGATDFVRHFDLPTQTRWKVIDSSPGRILVKWEEEGDRG